MHACAVIPQALEVTGDLGVKLKTLRHSSSIEAAEKGISIEDKVRIRCCCCLAVTIYPTPNDASTSVSI